MGFSISKEATWPSDNHKYYNNQYNNNYDDYNYHDDNYHDNKVSMCKKYCNALSAQHKAKNTFLQSHYEIR